MVIDEATEDLTEHIHTVLKSQMTDVLVKNKADLLSLTSCFKTLFDAGFGAYTVANIGEAAVINARRHKARTVHAHQSGAVQ